MPSLDTGKTELVAWIKERFPNGGTALDVGACDGKYFGLLGDYFTMDAVEVWEPNFNQLQNVGYREVYFGDASKFEYDHYDLVIFGDVLEHMPVKNAQHCLDYADKHSEDYVVGLPFLYYQGAIYGNPFERHIQPDLTPEVVAERYPQLELIFEAAYNYAYYHRRRVYAEK